MIEEADLTAERVLPQGTSTISAFAFARLPELAERFKTYTLYRLECGMRSTLVLGFIGLPTIGFHLESYFKQGHYPQATALLGAFYMLIGTRRLWARPCDAAVLDRGQPVGVAGGDRWRLGSRQSCTVCDHDIVPSPLRSRDATCSRRWGDCGRWFWTDLYGQDLARRVADVGAGADRLVAMGVMALGALSAGFAALHGAGRPDCGARAAGGGAIDAGVHAGICVVAIAGPFDAAGDHRACRSTMRGSSGI